MTVIPIRSTAKPGSSPERDHRNATQLLNTAMNYARLILRRYGQLAPFAFALDHEGQVARETMEIPRLPRDPQRLWKLLIEHLGDRVARGALEGVAACANVTLDEPSEEGYADAVIVTIELESGHALRVTVPYKIYGGQLRNLLPRRVTFGQLAVEETKPSLFPAPR